MTTTLPAPRSGAPSLTKAQKAAIVLAALSSETSGAIVREISEAHLKAFVRALSELKAVPTHLLHKIAQEFISEVEQSNSELSAGMEETRKMLGNLAQNERVGRILAELRGGGASVWERLATFKPQQLLPYLEEQRLPVAATIVSKLGHEQAATIFSAAEPDYAHALLTEIARGRPPSEETLDSLARAIEEDFLKPQSAAPSAEGVNEVVGEIVNFLPSAKREAFLRHLDAEDREIAKSVRRAVLTFQDLHLRLNEAGASALLRDIEKETLIKALQHGKVNAAETVDFLMANVSKRMAEQYSDEIAGAEPISDDEGESAQRAVIRKLRALAQSGEVKLLTPST